MIMIGMATWKSWEEAIFSNMNVMVSITALGVFIHCLGFDFFLEGSE